MNQVITVWYVTREALAAAPLLNLWEYAISEFQISGHWILAESYEFR